MAIGTAAALLGSAAIGAGASILGANKAADAQKQAAKVYAQQQEANRDLLNPTIQSGDRARGVLEQALGLQGREQQQGYYDDFQTDPGFQSSVDYGIQGIDRSGAARGMSMSGNQLAALQDYGQRQMYGAFQNRLSRLGALAQGGTQAAGSLAGVNTQAASGQAGALGNAGFYQGAGIQNAGNALAGGLSNYGVLSAYQGGIGGTPQPSIEAGSGYKSFI